MCSVDILILANGPGEITTWVRPVVQALRQELNLNPERDRAKARISVVLSPCPHSTGQEAAIMKSYPEVDRVQTAEHFFSFLLSGKTADNWDWYDRGIVIFLGGDQFYALILGRRLGYQTLVYAEWEARWYRWLDHFAVMKPEVMAKVPAKYHYKFTVVGDLIADINQSSQTKNLPLKPVIGLLPGSKPAKLAQGIPLCLAIAEKIQAQRPDVTFIIPVAPTLSLTTLAQYSDHQLNPIINQLGGVGGYLSSEQIVTTGGTTIKLITQFPAYDELIQCQLCLTTVGANTAELGSLAIPMIVLIPTQQLDAMRAWDGLPGILANLPGIGSSFAKLINWLVIKQKRLFAWPNIWAKAEIVPELIGRLQPNQIAEMVLDYLDHPEKLQQIRDQLIAVRGDKGASQKIARITIQKLHINSENL
ncbi:putative lipid-A-disaccharide synthase [Stanieria cyanosphaera PCC 7437]|uniref:Lipid-A-disaccharide synthase n=1 Tax=Stanieria cyanosphaera (strain ATCC 29371 / PCC 7437) TaxID=111780 RepID=K9XXI6_STAC7|nr:lipid-A-disaccharide synthase [Stanieria cyanosphaera]AFZ36377.1 putative lipid-A-disaccharide synthase [Stanieria cyanosphaera PCC 7437]